MHLSVSDIANSQSRSLNAALLRQRVCGAVEPAIQTCFFRIILEFSSGSRNRPTQFHASRIYFYPLTTETEFPTQTLSHLPSETFSIGYVEYVIRCSPGGQCSACHPCKVLFFRSLLRSVLRVRAWDTCKKSVVWRQQVSPAGHSLRIG